MIRFLAGVVVGTLGTLYIVAAFLPATKEQRHRDPLPTRTYGSVTAYRGIGHELESWTGPIT